MKYMATRLQCLSNYKLNSESSRNEPRLRNLLGHISIYDNVREYRKEQIMSFTFSSQPMSREPHLLQSPPPRQPRPQLQRQPPKQSPTNELPDYLNIEQVRVPCFQDFQAAIELQIATLGEIQTASKRLQALSHSCPTINEQDVSEVNVEEYCDESDTASDYDSYDGEGGWRSDEDNEGEESEDSMTDPESVRSECTSPVDEKGEDESSKLGPFVSLMGRGISIDF